MKDSTWFVAIMNIWLSVIIVLFMFAYSAFGLDLRQSTAVTIEVGPFVDATDGVTPETGLGLADDIEVSKAGAPFATVSSASLTHDSEGFYRWDVGTGTVDTLGPLVIKSVSSGVHVPVWLYCEVLPSNVWDSLYSTDKLQVDVTQVSGTSEDLPTATNLQTVDDNVDAVKLQTDNLTFTTSNKVDARVDYVGTNAVTTPDDFKADVSPLALEATLNLHEATAESILADTQGIQADLDNGTDGLGALKILIDAIQSTVDGLENLSAAEVLTQISNALGTYDGPTNAEMVAAFLAAETTPEAILVDTDKLVSTSPEIELDGSVYRFTTNALEQAPSGGGGGDATLANQTIMKASLEAIELSKITAGVWAAELITDGTAGQMLIRLHSWGAGKSVKSGDTYSYYGPDASTLIYSATHTSATRTVTAP